MLKSSLKHIQEKKGSPLWTTLFSFFIQADKDKCVFLGSQINTIIARNCPV